MTSKEDSLFLVASLAPTPTRLSATPRVSFRDECNRVKTQFASKKRYEKDTNERPLDIVNFKPQPSMLE